MSQKFYPNLNVFEEFLVCVNVKHFNFYKIY